MNRSEGRSRVAILDDYQGIAKSLAPWDELGLEVVSFADHLHGDGQVVARLADFDVVVAMRERTPFARRRLERLPRLRLLVTTGRVNASIDLQAARDLGITVSSTRSDISSTVELTWALILGVTRNLCAEDAAVRRGGWQLSVGADLAGTTLGLLGLGRIGKRMAQIGNAFGMHVIAWSQNLTDETCMEVGAQRVMKNELFGQCDVLSVHVALSERTRDLVDEAAFARMRQSAYLINTARGQIVTEAALVSALNEGAIAGAGIDVFDIEPLPPDSPLLTARNLLLSPHMGYVARRNYDLFYQDSVEDIRAFLDGSPIRVLNP